MDALLYRLFLLIYSPTMLVVTTWFFCGVTLLLLLTMIAYKLLLEHLEQHQTQVRNLYPSHIVHYLHEPSHSVPVPGSLADWQILADVMIQLSSQAVGERRLAIHELAHRLGVGNHLLRVMRSRLWVRRLKVVEQLGFLRMPEGSSVLREQLAVEKDSHVIAKLLWALSQIGGVAEGRLIIEQLQQHPVVSSKFNEHLFRNLLDSFRERGEGSAGLQFCRGIVYDRALSPLFKRDLIEACGSARFMPMVPMIRDICRVSDNDPAVQITCLRALGELGGDPLGELTIPALDNPDWRIRAVAARAAAQSPEAATRLGELLCDSNYHVRMNAATALGAMGNRGRAVLQRGLASADRFARDISAYTLQGI